MDAKSLFAIILGEAEKALKNEDMDLVFQILAHNELGLAIEFICDKFAEYNFILPESLGLKCQCIATQMELNPSKTWEGLIIEEDYSHQLRRIFREGADLSSYIEGIFQEIFVKLSPSTIQWTREFLDHDELSLAIDALCYGLINDKIDISKHVFDKIRTVLLDLGRDPEEWKGFLVKNDESFS